MEAAEAPNPPPTADDWAAEVTAAAAAKAAKRKQRPRLQPVSISPDKGADASYLDELGFGDILTAATSTPREEDDDKIESEAERMEEKLSESRPQSEKGPSTPTNANAIAPRDELDGDGEEAQGQNCGGPDVEKIARVSVDGEGEMARYSSLAGPAAADIQALCLDGIDACCGNDEASAALVPDEAKSGKREGKGVAECCDLRGRGGSDVSASFELSPLDKHESGNDANDRDLTVELSLIVNESAEYEGDVSAIVNESAEEEGDESLAILADSGADGGKSIEAASVAGDLVNEIVASALSNASGRGSEEKDAGDTSDERGANASIDEGSTLLGISQDSAALDLFKSRSSSVDDLSSVASSTESVVSSSASDIQVDTEWQRLQGEIGARQKRLARLLRGKEGTAYARMVREQEAYVNAQLLGRAQPEVPLSNATNKSLLDAIGNGFQSKDNKATASDGNAKASKKSPFRTIRSIFLDEYYHTLPGALSLLVHCVLYVTIYACVSKSLAWLCDVMVVGLSGWDDDNGNTFDLSPHENAFYLIVLMMSLATAKVTGLIYDWNENRSYHKRVEFSFRNKWHQQTWDVKAMNFFLGGELREEYEDGANGNAEAQSERGKMWGPRLKHLIDLLSFFVCYKCVDHFIYNLGALPLSDITDSVVEGLPSRHLQMHRDRHLKENGRSYACHSVLTALDNPYAADMLEWIAKMDINTAETRGWIRNAKECGWIGPVGDNADFFEDEESGDAGDSSDEPKLPTFLQQKRVMSALDEEYLEDAITEDAYANLVGETELRFYDPAREVLFLLASTAVGFGLLSYFDIPFLLI